MDNSEPPSAVASISFTSTDGINWSTNNTFPGDVYCTTIIRNKNNQYLSFGFSKLYRSDDLLNWETIAGGSRLNFLDVLCQDSIYLGVGDIGKISISIDDAHSWKDLRGEHLNSVVYGNGIFVAVGNKGTILTSKNDSTWNVEVSEVTGNLSKVIYNGIKFLSIVDSSNVILTSPNGKIWSNKVTNINDGILDISYGNNCYVAFSDKNVYTSLNGEIWATDSIERTFKSLRFQNNEFIAVIDYYGQIVTSETGHVWDTLKIIECINSDSSLTITNPKFQNVIYEKDKFIGITYGSQYVISGNTNNGWLLSSKFYGYSGLKDIAIGANKCVIVGENQISAYEKNSAEIYESSSFFQNYSKYALFDSAHTHKLNAIIHANNQFVAVGNYGTIFRSKTDPIPIIKKIITNPETDIKVKSINNSIKINIPTNFINTKLSIELFNGAGRKILSKELITNKQIININHSYISTGMYYLKFISKGIRQTIPFIILK